MAPMTTIKPPWHLQGSEYWRTKNRASSVPPGASMALRDDVSDLPSNTISATTWSTSSAPMPTAPSKPWNSSPPKPKFHNSCQWTPPCALPRNSSTVSKTHIPSSRSSTWATPSYKPSTNWHHCCGTSQGGRPKNDGHGSSQGGKLARRTSPAPPSHQYPTRHQHQQFAPSFRQHLGPLPANGRSHH
jgi:hypothetical protein